MKKLILLTLVATALFAQNKDAATRLLTVVASAGSLPATCSVGAIAFVSGATPGQQIYECSSTNTWTQQSGGFANPMTTAGDIIVGGVAGAAGRTAIGTTNQVLTVVGGVPTWVTGLTGNVTGNVSGTALSITGLLTLANTPLTTSQDILYDNAGSLGRLPIVSSGQCLGNTGGVWASLACSGGGGGGVSSVTIAGTTNQIAVSGTCTITSTGTCTLSIPNNPTLPGTTTSTFSGNLTGNVTGNASGTAATITGLLALANTPLTTTQDILFDNAGSLGRLPIVTSGNCLGNSGGVWSSLSCGGGGGSLTVDIGGSAIGTRSTLNFIAASGTTLSGADTGTQVNVTVAPDTSVIQSKANLQSGTAPNICTSSSGSGTTYTATCATTLTAYATKQTFLWNIDHVSASTAPSLNVDTLGAKTVTDSLGNALATTTTLAAGMEVPVWYDGTNFRVMTLPTGGSGGVLASLFVATDQTTTSTSFTTLGTADSVTFTCTATCNIAVIFLCSTYNSGTGISTLLNSVFIDGTQVDDGNQGVTTSATATPLVGEAMWKATGLTAASHTVEVKHLNSNAANTGHWRDRQLVVWQVP